MMGNCDKISNAFYSEDIHRYLDEIRDIPLLSAEEERLLAMKCAEGDEESIRKMVKSNLRLVFFIAKDYAGRGVALMDLIQEGSIGLIVAARKYDYTTNYRFSTYATKWIRQGVLRCLMNNAGPIRIPTHTAEKIRKVEAARSLLHQQLGSEPTLDEIAERVDLPPEKVVELLNLAPKVCSLDILTGENEKDSIGSLTADLDAMPPQEALIRQEMESTLKIVLGTLTERQQTVLRLHYGLDDGVEHSFEEIGKLLKISKERARQIEQQAIGKLSAQKTVMGLEDLLE